MNDLRSQGHAAQDWDLPLIPSESRIQVCNHKARLDLSSPLVFERLDGRDGV